MLQSNVHANKALLTSGPFTLCVGSSWALWGIGQHPWHPPTQCQQHPSVMTTDIPRHGPVSSGSRITPNDTPCLAPIIDMTSKQLLRPSGQSPVLTEVTWAAVCQSSPHRD